MVRDPAEMAPQERWLVLSGTLVVPCGRRIALFERKVPIIIFSEE